MRNDYAQRRRGPTKGYLVAAGLTDLAPMAKAVGMRPFYDIFELRGVGRRRPAGGSVRLQGCQGTARPKAIVQSDGE
ncbi:uncharacterized protein BCR38DRAFT_446301 [Pseudomassariella vexata]|uniref:Uncharacterized protein n=1 Tax=Pseudomassariella vexata TaxID=1141098 RepID=A0A1Y2DJ97_9PEZI|nr:uncharacterized protein BCR38DRAFT_446301 [Pseudomassariella vexata]ORY59323.1 hypothetical protein BCR38DRAFT_446301 [Pseudomassariella vexata]